MSPFSCIITRVLYTALFTSAGSCYLRSKALLNVLNGRGVPNHGVPTAYWWGGLLR